MKRLIGLIILLLLFSLILDPVSKDVFAMSVSDELVKETRYLSLKDLESKNSVNIVGENYKVVGFTNILKKSEGSKGNINESRELQSVYIVQPGDSLYLIAVRNNTTVQEIKDLNNLESDMLVVGQRLMLPGQTYGSDTPDSGVSDNKIYIVQPGDSLYKIAINNGSTVQEIKDLNNLESDMLFVGQELLLPGQADDGGTAEPPVNGDNKIYIVQPGDSLYKIAINNGTAVQELKDLNNLESDMLFVGQELLLPGQGGGNDIPDNEVPVVYFVKSGDSLWLISNKFNTTVNSIIEYNHLPDNSLYAGQLLYITQPVNGSNKVIYYVQYGDSLSSIADRFSISADNIMETNNLINEELTAGQKLYINIPDYSGVNYDIVLDYQVEAGDNINSVSNKFNISPWELRVYNNIRYDILTIGQDIKIPLLIKDKNMGSEMMVTDEEMDLLSRAVYSEARGEPFAGQVAVASVILNRVRNSLFPDTIEDVIFQPWQFTAVHDGQFWLEPNQTAFLAAQAALEGWDPSGGALYYYNPETAEDDWVFYRDVIIEIGDHYFAVSI